MQGRRPYASEPWDWASNRQTSRRKGNGTPHTGWHTRRPFWPSIFGFWRGRKQLLTGARRRVMALYASRSHSAIAASDADIRRPLAAPSMPPKPPKPPMPPQVTPRRREGGERCCARTSPREPNHGTGDGWAVAGWEIGRRQPTEAAHHAQLQLQTTSICSVGGDVQASPVAGLTSRSYHSLRQSHLPIDTSF